MELNREPKMKKSAEYVRESGSRTATGGYSSNRLTIIIVCTLFALIASGLGTSRAGVGGSRVWELSDPQAGKQEAFTSLVDGEGNLIISGATTAVGGREDLHTLKLNSSGGVVWRQSLDLGSRELPPVAGEADRAVAVALDSQGNVVVAGYGSVGANTNFLVMKYDGASGNELWGAPYQFNGSANGADYPTAVAVDSDNNIYIAGYSQHSVEQTDDAVLVKLAADGTFIRETRYDGGGHDRFNAIVVGDRTPGVGGGEFVVVSGYSWRNHGGRQDFDWLTVSYDGEGTLLWEESVDGGSGEDRGLKLALDPAGNPVVSGTITADNRKTILTLKYDEAGNGQGGAATLWQRSYAVGERNIPQGLWLDPGGEVYLTGSVFTNNGMDDFYTARYAGSSGAVVWENIYASPGTNKYEVPVAIVGDGDGGVFVTGYLQNGETGDKDFLTVKYHRENGHLLWHDAVGYPTNSGYGATGGNQYPLGIGVSLAGDLYVAGWSGVRTDFAGGNATVTAGSITTLTDGSQSWSTNQWKGYSALLSSGPNQGQNRRIAGNTDTTLTFDAAFTAPVASGDSYILNDPNDYNYFAIRYDHGALNPPSGLAAAVVDQNRIDLTWEDNSTTVNEEQFCLERCSGIGCENFIELTCVAGDLTAYSDTTPIPHVWYSYRLRSKQGGSNYSGYSETASALTTMVAYENPSWLYRYQGPLGDDAYGIAVGPDNHPVVTGSSVSALGQFDYYTVKLDRGTGLERWSHRYNDPDDQLDIATTVTVDANDAVLVSGYSSLFGGGPNSNDIFSLKFPAAGPDPYNLGYPNYGALWVAQYNGPDNGDDRSMAVKTASNGSSSVVVGYGRNANNNEDIYLLKYLADGTRAWHATPYDGPDHGDDLPTNVVFDPFGDLLVCGHSMNRYDYDQFLRKYDGNSGAPLWTVVVDSGFGHDKLNDVVSDTAGNVYAVGYLANSSGNLDLFIRKFSPTGSQLWTEIVDGPGHGFDEAVSVRYDAKLEEIVVAGTVTSATGSKDFHLRRYRSDGTLLWQRTLDRAGSDDFLVTMAMDGGGNVCAAGETDNGRNSDLLAVCYDTLGNATGFTLYNGEADRDETVTAMTVNSYGEMFVAGSTLNGAGNDDYLVVKCVTNLLLAPEPLTASPGYTTVSLAWHDLTVEEDSFHLWRKEGSCAAPTSFTPLAITAANATDFTDSGLTAGSQYCYRVEAYKGAITSVPLEVEVATLSPPAPGCFANPANTTRIDLSWTDVTASEQGFAISRCTGVDCTDFAPLTTLAAGSSGYQDGTVCELATNSGHPYSYQVRAFNDSENWSVASLCRNVAPLASQAVAGFTATTVSEGEIDLRWSDPNPDSSNYQLSRCTGSGCQPTFLAAVDGTPSGILLNYAMNESSWNGTGGEVRDSSGQGNHGTAKNGAASTSQGHTLGGGNFDGVNDTLEWGYSSGRPTNNFSLSAWVKTAASHGVDGESTGGTSGTSGQRYLFWPEHGGDSNSGAGVSVGTNGISVYEHGNGYLPPLAVYSGSLGTGWNHIVVTYTNKQPRIYLNGVLVRTGLTSLRAAVNAPIVAGGGTYGYFQGQMDEVLVFDHPLALGEVQALAQAGKIYRDTAVLPGTTYTYQLTAHKSSSCSWESAPATAAATSTTQTPCPLTAVATEANKVVLTWTDNFGSETGFEVDRCLGANCLAACTETSCLLTTVGAGVTTYADPTACPSNQYSYRVRAYQGSSRPYAWTAVCESAVTPPLPDPPTSLTATRASEQEIQLTWNDSNPAETGFTVERCEVGVECPTFTVIGSAAATSGQGSYLDRGPGGNGLTLGHTYRYRVRGEKTGSCGWPTASANEAEATPTLQAPIGLTTAAVNSTRIDLNWTNKTSWETGIDIERCEGAGCVNFAPVATVGKGKSTYSDLAPCTGVSYRYRVTPVNSGWGQSLPSAAVGGLATVASAPHTFRATAASESEVDLSWLDDNPDGDGFAVERCDDTLANCQATPALFQPLATTAESLPSAALSPDYVRYFQMNEAAWSYGTQVVDGSASHVHGNAYYATIEANGGIAGNAGKFDGTNGYVNIPNSASLQNGGSQTIALWVKPAVFSGQRTIYKKARAGEGMILLEANGKVSYTYGTTGSDTGSEGVTMQTFTTANPLPLGVWTQIVLVRDLAAMKLRWYMNGVLADEATALFAAAATNTAAATLGYGYSGRYQGLLDELIIYNRALGSEEIELTHRHYKYQMLLHMDEAAWPLNTAGAVLDSSAGNHPGKAMGHAAVVAGGRFGKAGSFDGVDDYLNLGVVELLTAPAAFTAELWFKRTADKTTTPTSHGINNVLLSQSSQAANNDNLEIGSSGSQVQVYLGSSTGTDGVKSVEANLVDNQWYHLVLTYNKDAGGDTLKLYVDGRQVGGWSDYTGTLKPATATPLTLGLARPDGSKPGAFSGLLDEVALYNYALTATEVGVRYGGAYRDGGLLSGTTHTYRVKGYKNSGCPWELSAPAQEVTLPAPAGVADLTAAALSNTEIALEWSDASGTETGYRVFRCQGAGCTDFSELVTLAANSESYADTSICAPDTYRYRVAALVGGQEILDSNGPVAATPPLPLAPTMLTNGNPSETEALLQWVDNMSDETGYAIDRCQGGGCQPNSGERVGTQTANAQKDEFAAGIKPAVWNQQGVVQTVSATAPPINLSDSSGTSKITPGSGQVELKTTTVGGGTPATYNYTFLALTDPGSLGNGDFDVQVDYSLPDGDRPPSSTNYMVHLRMQINLNGSDYLYVERNHTNSGGNYNAVSGLAGVNANGSLATSDSSGKLRLTRVNDLLSCYAWSGGMWKLLHSKAAPSLLGTTPVYLGLTQYAQRNEAAALRVLLDNFTFNRKVGNKFEYLDTTLSPGPTFTYKVYPYKGTCQWENQSATVTSTPQVGTPLNLTATTLHSSKVVLDWSDTTTSETAFAIERCAGSCLADGNFVALGETAANVHSYTDLTTLAATAYSYRVRAVKSTAPGWDSGYSNILALTTLAATPPANLIANRASEIRIDLAWQDTTVDESKFVVERGDAACTNFAPLTELGSGVVAYSDLTVDTVSGYCYRVKGCKNDLDPGAADNSWCSPFSGTAATVATAIAAPDPLTATASSTTRVDLAWANSSESESGFRLQRCEGESCANFTDLATPANLGPNVLNYGDDTACNGKVYRYRVRSEKSGAWNSPYSAVAQVATPTAQPVADLAVSEVIDSADNRLLHLAWSDTNPDEDGFTVERCQGSGCTDFQAVSTMVSQQDLTARIDSGYWSPFAQVQTVSDSTLPVAAADSSGQAKIEQLVGGVRMTATAVGGGVGANRATLKEANPAAVGSRDFELQVDYTLAGRVTTTVDQVYLRLRVDFPDPDGNDPVAADYIFIQQVATASGDKYQMTMRVDNASNSGELPTTDLGGKLRITRTANILTAFAWSNNGWQRIGPASPAMRPELIPASVEFGPLADRSQAVSLATVVQNFRSTMVYEEGNLPASANYCYRVTPVKSANCGWDAATTDLRRTVCSETGPARPTGLTATVDGMAVTLNWLDNSSDEDGFEVERLLFNGRYAVIDTMGAGVRQYRDTIGIDPNHTYTYRVRALRGSERSAASNETQASTQGWVEKSCEE